GIESPKTWWVGCKLENHYLQKLALHLLAITPHSASCEHEIIQVDCENLEVKEIIDLNVFVEERVNEPNNNDVIEPEDEPDYDINEVVSAAMNNME
ncbi:16507_t:CDS:2, partial [Gigaspora margarita]